MLKQLASLLMVVLIFAGGYFWYMAELVCPIPIAYRVGVLSEEFNLTPREARAAIADAESIWEEATGLDLFVEESGAALPINFIYDERQQFTNAEEELSSELEQARETNEQIEREYNQLVAQYEDLNDLYEKRRLAYEKNLAEYNDEVDEWNAQGGAPQDVYDEFTRQKTALDNEQADLNTLRAELSGLVDEINRLSEQANSSVDRYNEQVEAYNQAFTESAEFTQGDYQGNRINIYQFSDREELVLVLAHEFGHALGIDHVENEQSVMFVQMGEQSISEGLSTEDLSGFTAVCGDGTFMSKLSQITIW